MGLERLTFLRDHSKESVKSSELLRSERVSKLLQEKNLELREVYSSSERLTPCLISIEFAYPHKGYKNILKYVNSLDPSEKDSQSY